MIDKKYLENNNKFSTDIVFNEKSNLQYLTIKDRFPANLNDMKPIMRSFYTKT